MPDFSNDSEVSEGSYWSSPTKSFLVRDKIWNFAEDKLEIPNIHSKNFSKAVSIFNDKFLNYICKISPFFLLLIHSRVFPRVGFSSSESINSFNMIPLTWSSILNFGMNEHAMLDETCWMKQCQCKVRNSSNICLKMLDEMLDAFSLAFPVLGTEKCQNCEKSDVSSNK